MEDGFSFRSMIRLGNIPSGAFTLLQKRLSEWDEAVLMVEEVPGIFDLQMTWKRAPGLLKTLDLIDLGEKVVAECGIAPTQTPHETLISDVQTTVTRAFGTGGNA